MNSWNLYNHIALQIHMYHASWFWTSCITLQIYPMFTKTIIESGNWLTDDIIDAVQQILVAQFIGKVLVSFLAEHSPLMWRLKQLTDCSSKS